MSIKVIDWVIDHAPVKGSALLLLIMIADHANEDGTGAWPSIQTLAKKTRLGQRNVQYLLRHLEERGCIHTDFSAGPNGTNAYTVDLEGANFAGGCNGASKRVQTVAPKPSLTVLGLVG